MKNSFEVGGSGFLIEGKRVITNAHVVNGSTFITVIAHGSTVNAFFFFHSFFFFV